MSERRTLRGRVAGQSAMCAVVRAQAAAKPLTTLERVFGASPLTGQSRAVYRSALGELLVGDVLENLGPSWDVLHDLPLDGLVLDHLLVGRPGVFSVRAASYGRQEVVVDGDTLLVAGEERDDILRAKAEAAQVAALLRAALGHEVIVRPVLVVVSPRRFAVSRDADAVKVIGARELGRVLAQARPTLSGDEVARLSDVSDLASTWPVGDAVDLDTQQLNRDFGVIRSRVREAFARRLLWIGGAALVAYGAICAVIVAVVSTVMNS